MRNTQKSRENALRAPGAPNSPIVARDILRGPPLTFIEFLHDGDCQRFCAGLFGGGGTAAGTMLRELRNAAEFHYYGVQAGKLTESNAGTKKLLKTFVRKAYQGDPDRRGVRFWERVAWLVWRAYDDLTVLRARAERIKQQEIARIDRMPAKRASRASYMRGRRAKLRANPKRIKDGTRRNKNPRSSKRQRIR